MTASLKYLSYVAAAVVIAACSARGGSEFTPATSQISVTPQTPDWEARHIAHPACPQVVGMPTCLVLLADSGINPLCSPSSGACGLVPHDLQTRYHLGSSLHKGRGTIVAVVEEGDSPRAAYDLATYRRTFHLGKANFAKYNQKGLERDYPPNCQDYSWCIETELDIEMVSVSCPRCTIYLMEADATIAGLERAETSAVKLGATLISNSWTCYVSWTCGDPNLPKYFEASGVTYLASSGDFGHNNIGAPAALRTVVAVGGTQISKSGHTYTETLWDSAGGGCANPYNVGPPGIPRPPWQHNPDCHHRNVADASAEAGCEPGVAEYASQYEGWFDVCGTSVASPLMAGMFALAGNANRQNAGKTFWEAQHQNELYDVCHQYCLFSTYAYGGGWGSPKDLSPL